MNLEIANERRLQAAGFGNSKISVVIVLLIASLRKRILLVEHKKQYQALKS